MKKFFLLILFSSLLNAQLREVDHSNLDKVWHPTKNNYLYALSILIPSLTDRKPFLEYLVQKLLKQISENNLEKEIEIVTFVDNRSYTIGYARNVVLRQSMGRYIAFIDDDDDISDSYVRDIYKAIKKSPDCIAIKGVHTYQDKKPWYFFQGARFRVKTPFFRMLPAKDFQWKSTYQWQVKQSNADKYRIECRRFSVWNPVKRSIAISIPFNGWNIGEDLNWAERLLKKYPSLKEEAVDRKSVV